jgi:SH3-like domain-containing protein
MRFAQITAAAALVALAAQSAAAQPAPPELEPGEPVPAQAGPPPAVAATNVNLRQGPGTTYNIVTTIPAGAPVNIAGCNAGWCQVTFQGQNGYVIASSVGQGPPSGPPPGYYPPPPPVYVAPPPYYGPYYGGYYGGYYGPGPYWGGRGGWHRRW